MTQEGNNTVTTSSPKKPQKKIPLPQKLMVGGIAGVIGATCTYPIDIVKTRLQSQIANAKGVFPYSGPIDVFRQIVKKEGPAGLYRGLPPILVGIIPEKAIKLAVNDVLREALEDPNTGTISIPKQIIAAAGAGTTQVIATNPMEIVKIRMQTQQLLPVSEQMTAMQITKMLGLKGLYKGTTCTLLRDVPYGVVFFPTYATLKEYFTPAGEESSILSIVSAGAISGAGASCVVTPADVIKTRLQMRGASYTGIQECYRAIVSTEGHGALIKGMVPRMMVQAPLFGITLVAFELQKKYMAEQ